MGRGLAVYLFGVFVGALDTSIIGPAFPLIAADFHVSLDWVAWTVTAYTVAYAAATVLAGALGDRYGRRGLFALGLALFGIGSLVAVLSGALWVFLVARAIQGAGAGTIFPNAQAEGIGFFPMERRGLALGIFGAIFGVAAIIGPNVGGALAQYFGWSSIFLINLPLAAIALIFTATLPSKAGETRTLPDIVGGISFALAIAGALLTLTYTGVWRWGMLAAAIVLFLVFLTRQRRPNGSPFLNTTALTSGAGVALVAGAAIVGLDMAAAVFVPTLVQDELGFGVLASGVALMPAALTGAVLAGVGGHLTDRVGPRLVLRVGLVAGAIGGLLLAWPGLGLARFIVAMVFLGVGTAFTMGAPLNRMALALYKEKRSGEALSLIAVFRTVGLAAGPVLLTLASRQAGFSGMFGVVTLASLVGVLIFAAVPNLGRATDRAAESEGA